MTPTGTGAAITRLAVIPAPTAAAQADALGSGQRLTRCAAGGEAAMLG